MLCGVDYPCHLPNFALLRVVIYFFESAVWYAVQCSDGFLSEEADGRGIEVSVAYTLPQAQPSIFHHEK
jgi:hypothetical protein